MLIWAQQMWLYPPPGHTVADMSDPDISRLCIIGPSLREGITPGNIGGAEASGLRSQDQSLNNRTVRSPGQLEDPTHALGIHWPGLHSSMLIQSGAEAEPEGQEAPPGALTLPWVGRRRWAGTPTLGGCCIDHGWRIGAEGSDEGT